MIGTNDASGAFSPGDPSPGDPSPGDPSPGDTAPGGTEPDLVASPHARAAAKIRECEAVIRAALAEQLGRIAEIERLGSYADDGARSMRVWLREALNLSDGEAKSRVLVAHAVRERTTVSGARLPADCPTTGAAIDSGAITLGQARVIVDGMAALPPNITDVERGEAERTLSAGAQRFWPRETRALAEHIRYLLDQDGALREEEQQIGRRELHFGTGRDGMTTVKGRLDRVAGAQLKTILDALATPEPATNGDKDPRSPAKRHADAFVRALDIVLDSDGLPRTGGTRPQITITIDFHTLTNDLTGDTGTLTTTGQPLSAAQVRQLACGAEILPVVMSGEGVPLDLGRSQRTAPPHLRAALLARDGCCAFPGCDHPPGTPEAHHVVEWLAGGPTTVDNMVMLCGHHHRIVHGHQWDIAFQEGRPIFVPPARKDPTRTPRPGGRPPHHPPFTRSIAADEPVTDHPTQQDLELVT